MSATLNEDQRSLVAKWIEEGLSAGEIQSKIKDDFSISLTYLDLRLLLDDLKVVPQEKNDETPTEEDPAAASNSAALAGDTVEAELMPDAPLGGAVSVTIDQITRPNSLISGKVTFSDGQKAGWALDNTGRLGLDPETPGYRPSQEDVMAFQMELQRAAQSSGL